LTLPAGATLTAAHAVVLQHDQIGYGRVDEDIWQPLTKAGGRATGTLPLTGIPPGDHRVQIRLTGDDGAQWRTTVPFTVAGFTPLWSHPVAGQQAAMARYEDLVVTAATTGHVRAFRPTTDRPRPTGPPRSARCTTTRWPTPTWTDCSFRPATTTSTRWWPRPAARRGGPTSA